MLIFDYQLLIGKKQSGAACAAQSAMENRQSAILVSTFFVDEFLIISSREQAVEFAGVLELDLDDPGAVRIFIDLFGRG